MLQDGIKFSCASIGHSRRDLIVEHLNEKPPHSRAWRSPRPLKLRAHITYLNTSSARDSSGRFVAHTELMSMDPNWVTSNHISGLAPAVTSCHQRSSISMAINGEYHAAFSRGKSPPGMRSRNISGCSGNTVRVQTRAPIVR